MLIVTSVMNKSQSAEDVKYISRISRAVIMSLRDQAREASLLLQCSLWPQNRQNLR